MKGLPWDDPDADPIADMQDVAEKYRPPAYEIYDRTGERIVNAKEFNLGFSAGWRNDELIDDHSYSFHNGYEWGQVARKDIG